MSNQYYSGPGKAYFNSPQGMCGLQASDTNGAIQFSVEEKTTTRGAAMFGDMFETTTDVTGKISLTPFSDWGLLPVMFPAFTGADTSGVTTKQGGVTGAAGALSVGTYAHDPTAAGGGTMYGAGVFTPDGRLYNFVRCAITKHPTLTLGASSLLYSGIELSAIGQYNQLPGATEFLMSLNTGASSGAPITESGGTDPSTGYIFPYGQFSEEHWLGTWGSTILTANMEAEDGWQVVPDIKYNTITVQKITRAMILSSSRFMIKARLTGATHSAILARPLAHTAGSPMPGASVSPSTQNLVLTSGSGKTVTLYNCEIKGAGFSFGGTKLGTDEVAFVQKMTPSSSIAATPSLVFAG